MTSRAEENVQRLRLQQLFPQNDGLKDLESFKREKFKINTWINVIKANCDSDRLKQIDGTGKNCSKRLYEL